MPEIFSSSDNKHLFKSIFSNENKTGGGPIENLDYLPDQLKAFITYESDKVAQNVINKKEISFCGYLFKINSCWETIAQEVTGKKQTNENK